MKIFLHIGLPKTGTTSFQYHMARACSDAPRDGIWYPPHGITQRDPSHAWFGDAMRSGDTQGIAAALADFEGKADTVLLSDENIYVEAPGVSPATVDAVKALMDPHDVTLINVTRDAAPWRRSFYLQCVEMRRSKAKFDHPTANQMWQTALPHDAFFASPYPAALQDVPALQAMIADMVGAADVIELPYAQNDDVVQTICGALGLTATGPSAAVQRNPSLTDVQGEVLRQANAQRPLDGRMIRALNRMANGTMPRPRVLAQIAAWQSHYDWKSLGYVANPPLRYSAGDFAALVDQLQTMAQSIDE